MAKYVVWRISAIRALQLTALVVTVLAAWCMATVILHLMLGDIMPIEHSQIVAFVMLALAALIVQVYLWIKLALLRINDRMHGWALRR